MENNSDSVLEMYLYETNNLGFLKSFSRKY